MNEEWADSLPSVSYTERGAQPGDLGVPHAREIERDEDDRFW